MCLTESHDPCQFDEYQEEEKHDLQFEDESLDNNLEDFQEVTNMKKSETKKSLAALEKSLAFEAEAEEKDVENVNEIFVDTNAFSETSQTSEINSEQEITKSVLINDLKKLNIQTEYKEDSLLEKWDPKELEFNSAKNFYGFNDQNGEALLYGYGWA